MTGFEQDLVAAGRRWYRRRARRRAAAIAVPLCVVAAVVAATLFGTPEREVPAPAAEVPTRAPAPVAALPGLFGDGTLSLAQMRGEPALVIFGDAPGAATLASRVVPILYAVDRPLAEADVPAEVRTYTALDRGGVYALRFGIAGPPASVLVDSTGAIVAVRRGSLDQEWLRGAVAELRETDRRELAATIARFSALRPSVRVDPPTALQAMIDRWLGDPQAVETYVLRSDEQVDVYMAVGPAGTCVLFDQIRRFIEPPAESSAGGCRTRREGDAGPYLLRGGRVGAVVPDGTRDVVAELHDGTTVPVDVRDNVIFETFDRPPERIRWTTRDGVGQGFPLGG